MIDYSEKRDFIRMRVESDMTFSYNGQTYAGTCIDLSSKGMQVETDANAAIATGTNIRVNIPSTHPQLPGLEADTKVLRVDALEDNRIALGLEITAMQ